MLKIPLFINYYAATYKTQICRESIPDDLVFRIYEDNDEYYAYVPYRIGASAVTTWQIS
jgi:hypothetical protein